MRHISTSRLTRLIAVSVAATAVAAPTAQARPDVPAPNAPAAEVVQAPAPRTDLRSPDTRDFAQRGGAPDAAPAVRTPVARTDMRSPDARDFADRGGIPEAVPTFVVTRPSGFEWDDAAVGAAGVLGLTLLLGGLAVSTRVRRTHARPA